MTPAHRQRAVRRGAWHQSGCRDQQTRLAAFHDQVDDVGQAALEYLAGLGGCASVDLIVTSPPFFAQRSYGGDGEDLAG
ncbi:hypothetical protein OIE62_39020 [Streptomyces scopuliridis]|uniref:Uncharacterized protein n=1 Tax=Streptomyces scopuliridis TaxID=452529 RepID=A0ACD4ZBX3_9ACTN|nr:hypothetical protein [Streptomyces scopuliridis]WSB31641.1 hypothetical protein OG949_01295 [Streptomyces scopuliridis]WSB95889.1 hypothetical protein OG835_01905 [Streptomyces scopuliridis]WSC10404.1 hypothetical protein OIE62_39020 [Streptomyces scopuliridis]